MSDEERPYRDHSESELNRALKDYRSLRRQAERDQDSYVRQWKPVPDWVWSSEDYVEYDRQMRVYDQHIRTIEREFQLRRDRRRIARERREKRPSAAGTSFTDRLLANIERFDPSKASSDDLRQLKQAIDTLSEKIVRTLERRGDLS
jgi:hypothetical protein